MFISCRTDVVTYFRNVLRDVSSRVGIDRHLAVIKRSTIVEVTKASGVLHAAFSQDRMLDQTLTCVHLKQPPGFAAHTADRRRHRKV